MGNSVGQEQGTGVVFMISPPEQTDCLCHEHGYGMAMTGHGLNDEWPGHTTPTTIGLGGGEALVFVEQEGCGCRISTR